MRAVDKEVLRRLPLAEAVLRVLAFVIEESFLKSIYERHRQRCYDKFISFALLTDLICDALLQHGGSARKSFERADEQGRMPVSSPAAYGKLRRLPVGLSMALLAEGAARLAELFDPAQVTYQVPFSLMKLAVVIVDGKTIKRVAKRLKPTQGIVGGLLGGKALVAMTPHNGLAIAMNAHPDGETNDAALVEGLLPQVRARLDGSRLWVADRQFCDLVQTQRFTAEGDHFLIRYHPKVSFHADRKRKSRGGTDRLGRRYKEEWGWLGTGQNPQRRYVRRITLFRPGTESVILVTDLLDPDTHLAIDLLDLYLERWGIERMFQQVTEVFQLQRLIGSSPLATIFQCAFCLLLYNIIQLVRAYVAEGNGQEARSISTEKLFYDTQRQLVACDEVLDRRVVVAHLLVPLTIAELKCQLRRLLKGVWRERWRKAPTKSRYSRKEATPIVGGHTSVYRVLQDQRESDNTSREPDR